MAVTTKAIGLRLPFNIIERIEQVRIRMQKRTRVTVTRTQMILRMIENGCTDYEKKMDREERKR